MSYKIVDDVVSVTSDWKLINNGYVAIEPRDPNNFVTGKELESVEIDAWKGIRDVFDYCRELQAENHKLRAGFKQLSKVLTEICQSFDKEAK